MARIAFFAERLPPDDDPISVFSYELMCSLADQQHEIRVISTYREDLSLPPTHNRVEVIRPFKRWGWLEVPRLVPSLLEFRPDVLHVIQPRAESLEGLTSAMNAVPALAPLVGAGVVVSSFYDLREERLKKYRALLLSSSAVTVMNRPQQELLESYFDRAPDLRRRPRVVILPAPAVASHDETTSSGAGAEGGLAVSDALRGFFDRFEKVIFVPGDVADHRDPETLFALIAETLARFSDVGLVFGGGWGKLPARTRHSLMEQIESTGARVLFSGPLSAEAQRFCFERSHSVFTAFLPVESLQLTRVLREALVNAAPVVMSREQAEVDALPWKDRRSSVIAGSDPQSWRQALHEALEADELITEIRDQLPEFSRSEAVDHPSNVMSRTYAELMARRS